MSIDFPYEKKYIEEGFLIDPRVNVEIKTNRGFLVVKFLLDSGADVTTLPINPYLELFDFRINKKDKVKIGGVEGRGVNAYPLGLECKINQINFKLRCYLIQSNIDPLLGRLDFWTIFSINFDNLKLKTSLHSLKK